jgi:hypothetical protein
MGEREEARGNDASSFFSPFFLSFFFLHLRVKCLVSCSFSFRELVMAEHDLGGTWPGDELENTRPQSAIIIQMRAILDHTGVRAVRAGTPCYPKGDNLNESGRIEIGEPVWRYKIGQDSTLDGDPNVCFRHLNNMDGGIKAVFVGFATADFLPKATSSEGLNATQNISVHVANYGTGVYNGCRLAKRFSPIFVRQLPPHLCDPKKTMIRKQKGTWTPVIQPIMFPADQIRGQTPICPTDMLLQILYDNLQTIRLGDDDMGLGPRDTQDRFNETFEKTALTNASPIRKHLANAGYGGQSFEDDNKDSLPHVPHAAHTIGLGEEFVAEVDQGMMHLFKVSKELEDTTVIVECQKLCHYLTDLIADGRVKLAEGFIKSTLISMVQGTFLRVFGYMVEGELYHREWNYIGRVYKDAKPESLDIPFMLNP